MSLTPARALMGRPVWVGIFDVGVVDDVVIGADLGVVLGLVVETRAGRHCFLPWPAARVDESGIHAGNAATLLGEVELAYYLESGTRLSRLIGLAVSDSGETWHEVVSNVLLDSGGRVRELALSGGRGRRGSRTARIEDTRVRWREGRLLELEIATPVLRRQRQHLPEPNLEATLQPS